MHSNDSLYRRQLSLPSVKFHHHVALRAIYGVPQGAAGLYRPFGILQPTQSADDRVLAYRTEVAEDLTPLS
jgi:hypothetical protein